MTGASLGVAGVCLQTLVRNPLADPYLLGVSAGASLGAVLAMTAASAVAVNVQLQADPTELRGVMFWLLGPVAGTSAGMRDG